MNKRLNLSIIIFVVFLVEIFHYASGFFVVGNTNELLLLVAAVIVLQFIFVPVMLKSGYFMFEPMTHVIISVLLGVSVKTIYILGGAGENRVVDEKLLMGEDPSALLYGTFVIVIGVLFFILGYIASKSKVSFSRPVENKSWDYNLVMFLSITVLAVSVLGFMLFVDTAGISVSSFEDLSKKRFQSEGTTSASRLETLPYYFYRLALLAKLPLYILLVWKIQHNSAWNSRVGILLLIAAFMTLFIPFFISNRAGVALALMDIMVIVYLLKGKLNMRVLGVGMAIGLVLVMVSSVIRSSEVGGSLYDKSFGARHYVGLTKTAHIVNAFPDKIDFYKGETLVGWVFALVPSSIWPDKPVSTELPYDLGKQVFGLKKSAIPPGIIAEFYINFGVFGVVVGMYLIGLFLKGIHNFMIKRMRSQDMVIIYAIVISRLSIFLFNNGFGVAMLKTLADLIPALLCIWFVRQRMVKVRPKKQLIKNPS